MVQERCVFKLEMLVTGTFEAMQGVLYVFTDCHSPLEKGLNTSESIEIHQIIPSKSHLKIPFSPQASKAITKFSN